ncbi:MAG: hypothetical protein HY782_02625 [Chloroflexi bacterium]|nr:hypothetical protein [Chloroflexota bacterium]
MATSPQENPGWKFWLSWVLASMAGVMVYILTFHIVLPILGTVVLRVASSWMMWLALAVFVPQVIGLGAAIGVAQWLVLRKYLTRTRNWTLATLVGHSLSFVVPQTFHVWEEGVAPFLFSGVALGLLQWLVLRGQVANGMWWIAITLAAWILAYAASRFAYVTGLYFGLFQLVTVVLVSATVGGVGIIWLLRRSTLAYI